MDDFSDLFWKFIGLPLPVCSLLTTGVCGDGASGPAGQEPLKQRQKTWNKFQGMNWFQGIQTAIFFFFV